MRADAARPACVQANYRSGYMLYSQFVPVTASWSALDQGAGDAVVAGAASTAASTAASSAASPLTSSAVAPGATAGAAAEGDDGDSCAERRASPLTAVPTAAPPVAGEAAVAAEDNVPGAGCGAPPRFFTPRECARLQGFPEDFRIDGSVPWARGAGRRGAGGAGAGHVGGRPLSTAPWRPPATALQVPQSEPRPLLPTDRERGFPASGGCNRRGDLIRPGCPSLRDEGGRGRSCCGGGSGSRPGWSPPSWRARCGEAQGAQQRRRRSRASRDAGNIGSPAACPRHRACVQCRPLPWRTRGDSPLALLLTGWACPEPLLWRSGARRLSRRTAPQKEKETSSCGR